MAASGNIVFVMNTIETTGVVDAQASVALGSDPPIAGQSRVGVIVLVPEGADISETAWTKTVADQPRVRFLEGVPLRTFIAPPTANPFMTKGRVVLVPFPFDNMTAGEGYHCPPFA